MVLLTPRFALYVGGLTSGLLKVPGKHTGALVAFLTDQPGFAPVPQAERSHLGSFRESGSCKGCEPITVTSRPRREGIVLVMRPPTCAAGTGASPRSATIRDSE